MKPESTSASNHPECKEVVAYLAVKAVGVEESTMRSQRPICMNFLGFIGNQPLHDVTQGDLVEYLEGTTGARGKSRRQQKLATSTKRHRFIVIRDMIEAVTDPKTRALTGKNPYPRKNASPPVKVLSRKQIHELRLAPSSFQEEMIISFLLETGLRSSAACQVTLGDIETIVDEFGPIHYVTFTGGGVGLKGLPPHTKVPIVWFGVELDRWISQHPRRRDPTAPLFFTQSNRSRGRAFTSNSLWELVQRVGSRAGIPDLHPHRFRHTSATLRIASGQSIEYVRQALGWTSLSAMPSVYVDLSVDFEAATRQAYRLRVGDSSETKCLLCGFENEAIVQFCTGCRVRLVEPARVDPALARRLAVFEAFVPNPAQFFLQRLAVMFHLLRLDQARRDWGDG